MAKIRFQAELQEHAGHHRHDDWHRQPAARPAQCGWSEFIKLSAT
jgi:hypothetical protein